MHACESFIADRAHPRDCQAPGTVQCEHMERSKQKVATYVMSSRDTKIKRTLLESGLEL